MVARDYRSGARWLWAAWLVVVAGPAAAQARAPLPISRDSTGVLTAVRVIDLRQVCRCPVVRLDSVVRVGSRAGAFNVLDQPAALVLSAADVSRLALARHRIVRASLNSITRAARDTVLMAIQIVRAGRSNPSIMVVVTPPSGMTTAFLVSLVPHRGRWRVAEQRVLYEP